MFICQKWWLVSPLKNKITGFYFRVFLMTFSVLLKWYTRVKLATVERICGVGFSEARLI
jgi:hypothetical protein